jgi:hypothetical protein
VDLRKTYSDEELTDLLGYTSEELVSFDELINFDFEKLSDEDLPDSAFVEEDLDLPTEFTVSLSYAQNDMVETALIVAGEDRAEAITKICREFLEKNTPDKIAEVEARVKEWSKGRETDKAETPLDDNVAEKVDEPESEEDTGKEAV